MTRRALALLLVVLVAAGPAAGLDVAFTRIADTCTPIPGGSGTFSQLVEPSVDAGQVVFNALGGIYRHDGTALSVVADTGTAVPDGTGSFKFYWGGQSSVDGGDVVFVAADDATELPGVYRWSGGGVSRIADTTTTAPPGPGTFTSFGDVSASGGAVAFTAVASGLEGVYLDPGGGLVRVADTTTVPPGQIDPFASILVGSPRSALRPMVDTGEVAFLAAPFPSGFGIYRGAGGGLTRIVDSTSMFPGGEPIAFAYPHSLDAGTVSFVACEVFPDFPDCSGQIGVLTGDGGPLQTVADLGTLVPEGMGTFTQFQEFASGFPMTSIDAGRVAFYGVSATGAGIYLYDGSSRHKIIDTTDTIAGHPVTHLHFGQEALSGDQLAFFADGAIYSADLSGVESPSPIDAPVGTIVGWHKSLAGTPALPPGWEELNGQMLSDGQSPYDGLLLPDLNGALGGRGRFLRGGECSGAMEEDGFQGHHHAFSCCAEYIDDGGAYYSDPNPFFNQTGYDLATIIVGGVTTGVHGAVNVDDETRPVNDSVVWILKTRAASPLPIGSIVAWNGDFANTPALPGGWAPFDGATMIDDGGDYHGTTLPDWNGGGHFLRGGTASTLAAPEPQAIQGHQHAVSRDAEYFFASNVLGTGDRVNDFPANLGVLDPIDGSHGPVRFGTETRPINMTVVWLMKTSGGPLPTGAILAWHPNLGAPPRLPEGAVQLSGQTIDDPLSPYDGQTLPDLNGERRFLRGGSVSGDLQDDQFQGHRHAVTFDDSRFVEANDKAWGGDGLFADDYIATVVATDPTTDPAYGTARPELETRPTNMSVVWVMRIHRPVEQVAISAPGASGSVLGGSGEVGGIDYAFSGAANGSFSAGYHEVALDEAGPYLDSPGSIDFTLPSDPVQFWEMDFDAGFTDVTLTFGYDDSNFAPFFNEGSLEVYHYVDLFMGCTPGADCDWVPLPVVSRDTVANTITVTTTGFSQLVLGGPSLPGTSLWLFEGTAQGGTLEVTVGVVSLQLTTTSGQSAAAVAQAVADAINGDGLLSGSGVGAMASGGQVTITGGAGSVGLADAGLTLTTPGIPALPIGWALLLAGALGVHALRRRRA